MAQNHTEIARMLDDLSQLLRGGKTHFQRALINAQGASGRASAIAALEITKQIAVIYRQKVDGTAYLPCSTWSIICEFINAQYPDETRISDEAIHAALVAQYPAQSDALNTMKIVMDRVTENIEARLGAGSSSTAALNTALTNFFEREDTIARRALQLVTPENRQALTTTLIALQTAFEPDYNSDPAGRPS